MAYDHGVLKWPIGDLVKLQADEVAQWFDRAALPHGDLFRDPDHPVVRTWNRGDEGKRRTTLEDLEAAYRASID